MRDQRQIVVPPERRREEMFTQRYERLLSWALRLTNQNRQTAEDLVQDAYIQFVLGRTSLEEIENIDGYLRRMLRYMHLSKLNRNAEKVLDQTLSIDDNEFLHQRWQTIEPPDRMQAREELCQICLYACTRKETSRAGSVLILRFFHDYNPHEIAQVVRSSRHCVDQWQRLARNELKLYLKRPTRLKIVTAKTQTPVKVDLSNLSGDVIGELRNVIFRFRDGECLPIEQLRDIYLEQNDRALSTKALAHIVSCRSCLDLVNQILCLPSLAERYLDRPNERKEPPHNEGGGGISSGDGTSDLPTRYKKRLREVREHKPQELCVSVNGLFVGSLKVRSTCSELVLNLSHEGKIEFVEVNSEQGVQLLFLSLGLPPSSTSEEWASIELSEGRVLEARLSSTTQTLHLKYQDPELDIAAVPIPLKLIRQESLSRVTQLLRSLKRRIVATLISDKEEEEYRADRSEQGLPNPLSAILLKPLRTNPYVVAVLVAILAVSSLVFFRYRKEPVPNGLTLLHQASLAEEGLNKIPGQVTHRFINLEERQAPAGLLMAKRKIEVWEQPARGDRSRRVYDEANQLVAADWETPDSGRMVYHHGAIPQKQSEMGAKDRLLFKPEDIWRLDLSSKEFSSLIAEAEAQVQQSPSSYVITGTESLPISEARLIRATLTLRRPDLHAIEQTFLIRRGDELREYRFAEVGFETLPEKSVPQVVFEIDRDLNKLTPETRKPDRLVPSRSDSRGLPSLPVASTELEIEVAYLLDQVKGDRGEQLTLSRTRDGLLRIEGVVDTNERKAELLHGLASIGNNPAVRIDIATAVEKIRHQPFNKSAAKGISGVEETAYTIAVYQELRNYFAKNNPDPQIFSSDGSRKDDLDEVVRSFSSRTVDRAYRLLFHAIELRRLVNRFANVDMRTISPDAREKWLAMLRQHAESFERENALLRKAIQPIFFPTESLSVSEELEIKTDLDLSLAIERLQSLAAINNEAIRAAFTISTRSSSAQLKSEQFRRSLVEAEDLARLIKDYSTGTHK